jgi:hypothetical protein
MVGWEKTSDDLSLTVLAKSLCKAWVVFGQIMQDGIGGSATICCEVGPISWTMHLLHIFIGFIHAKNKGFGRLWLVLHKLCIYLGISLFSGYKSRRIIQQQQRPHPQQVSVQQRQQIRFLNDSQHEARQIPNAIAIVAPTIIPSHKLGPYRHRQ